jgi:hypothetical protein
MAKGNPACIFSQKSTFAQSICGELYIIYAGKPRRVPSTTSNPLQVG